MQSLTTPWLLGIDRQSIEFRIRSRRAYTAVRVSDTTRNRIMEYILYTISRLHWRQSKISGKLVIEPNPTE